MLEDRRSRAVQRVSDTHDQCVQQGRFDENGDAPRVGFASFLGVPKSFHGASANEEEASDDEERDEGVGGEGEGPVETSEDLRAESVVGLGEVVCAEYPVAWCS